MNTPEPEQGAPAALPSGRFTGREAFQQLVRDALACAAREGWREIVMCDSDFADRDMSRTMTSVADTSPSSTATTCSAIGISTPTLSASATTVRAVLTPSATIFISATMSSSLRPRPSSWPT